MAKDANCGIRIVLYNRGVKVDVILRVDADGWREKRLEEGRVAVLGFIHVGLSD